MSDPVADFFTQIRNAYQARLLSLVLVHSLFKEQLAKLLLAHGFVAKVTTQDKASKKYLLIELKYHGRKPAIKVIRQISKPGRRIYSSAEQIPMVRDGIGITLVSTPQGVLDNKQARKKGLGGEIVGQVW